MRLNLRRFDSFYGGGGKAVVEGDTEGALAGADVVVEGELKASSFFFLQYINFPFFETGKMKYFSDGSALEKTPPLARVWLFMRPPPGR